MPKASHVSNRVMDMKNGSDKEQVVVGNVGSLPIFGGVCGEWACYL